MSSPSVPIEQTKAASYAQKAFGATHNVEFNKDREAVLKNKPEPTSDQVLKQEVQHKIVGDMINNNKATPEDRRNAVRMLTLLDN
ncbi:MAG: hypothetical protein KGO93_03000 [Cyanobacteria bacterium REEB446]|nr:hypothetical protein [Cyanobacteria bacterium REEB446]